MILFQEPLLQPGIDQDGKKYLLGSFDDQLYILDIAECHQISKQKTENIFSNQRFSSGDKFDK